MATILHVRVCARWAQALALLLLGWSWCGGGALAGCTTGSVTCYEDEVQPSQTQTLGPHVSIGAMTLEWCAQTCHNHNTSYTLAGVEYGIRCYCGTHVHANSVQVDTGCDEHCLGNASQDCGGAFHIGVYPFHCSGAPVAPPPTPPPPPPPCTMPNQPNCSEVYNPCLDKSLHYHTLPFCDATLPVARRVGDMLQRMTQAEKIAMLGHTGTPVKALGIPAYNWWGEATSGASSGFMPRRTTKFAYPITTAMAFNRSLWQATGAQIGREVVDRRCPPLPVGRVVLVADLATAALDGGWLLPAMEVVVAVGGGALDNVNRGAEVGVVLRWLRWPHRRRAR